MFAGMVIKAWDLCMATMNVGEKCLLTCRSDYAYGDSGSPPVIPPKATLIFEMELLDFTKVFSSMFWTKSYCSLSILFPRRLRLLT